MDDGRLYSAQTSKTAESFIKAVRENVSEFGFGIRAVFDLKKMYEEQGVEVAEDFEAYSILLCNFQRSYISMRRNPKRAAVLLLPKQIVVRDNGDGVIVEYLPFSRSQILAALPEDESFADSLHKSCQKIVRLIDGCR